VPILETPRLRLDELTLDDAGFILELLNEEAFIRYIGDKGVRSRADAQRYITDGPRASYERFGHGLYRVALQEEGSPLGICGLLKRDTLEDPDIGFAFLQQHWSKGYAFESASAVLSHARGTLGLARILAITSPDNEPSIGLLGKLGFTFERMARLTEGEPDVKVFVSEVPHPPRRGAAPSLRRRARGSGTSRPRARRTA
jgi:RimJ/RimL family protein N-acetyltransferase